MSILFITSNDAFHSTTKYFRRTLSETVIRYISLKCKKELRFQAWLNLYINQVSQSPYSELKKKRYQTTVSKGKQSMIVFGHFRKHTYLTWKTELIQCSQVTIRFHTGRGEPESYTFIFPVCMEIKLSVNNKVTSQKRVRPGHITLTLKTGPQMTYKIKNTSKINEINKTLTSSSVTNDCEQSL